MAVLKDDWFKSQLVAQYKDLCEKAVDPELKRGRRRVATYKAQAYGEVIEAYDRFRGGKQDGKV